jgi:hypothetical protein
LVIQCFQSGFRLPGYYGQDATAGYPILVVGCTEKAIWRFFPGGESCSGDLAAILSFAAGTRKPDHLSEAGLPGDLVSPGSLVAGIGFEPMTFYRAAPPRDKPLLAFEKPMPARIWPTPEGADRSGSEAS